MLATRWSPWNEMQSQMGRLQNEMNSLFGRSDTTNGRRFTPRSYPALNIWEDDDQLLVEAELPGMELQDLEIYVNGGNQLSIKGNRKVPTNDHGTWHRRECGYGKFARVIELPQFVDAEKVQASFKHGVLTVKLPKQETSKPRKIQVKSE